MAEETNNTIFRLDLSSELRHGVAVSNLAYRVSRELGFSEELSYEMALAGMVHDIGKLRLKSYIYGQEASALLVEEMNFVRMHSMLGYEALKADGGYSDFVMESVLYHHENYDGSGYPENLSGDEIPIGARVLRVCDVYCALRMNRPYRRAFDQKTAMELMIEEVKNFDMWVFLAFQRVVHAAETNPFPTGEGILLGDQPVE